MKPGSESTTAQATELDTTPASTASPEQQERDRLFDAAIEHLDQSPSTQAFTETTDLDAKKPGEEGAAGEGDGEGKDKEKEKPVEQPRDDKGKFAAAKKAEADAAAAAKKAADAGPKLDDVLSKLPADQQDAVKKIVAKAQADVAAAEEKAKRHTSQVDGYKRKLEESRIQLEAAKKAGDPTAQKKAQEQATAAKAKLAELKQDHPNIAEAIDAAIAAEREAMRKELGGQLADLQKRVAPIVEKESKEAVDAEHAAIAKKHPDWETVVETSEFLDWYKQQPAEVKALAKGDAAAETRLFDLYRLDIPLETAEQIAARVKAETERAAADKVAALRDRQRRDAAGPSGKPTAAPSKTESQADANTAMFDAAVDRVAKELHVA
jgi:hypothetical protein